MTKSMVLAAVLFLAGQASFAADADKKYYEVTSVTVEDVTDTHPEFDLSAPVTTQAVPTGSQCEATGQQYEVLTSLDPIKAELDTLTVVVDQIINIGQKIWKVIELGRPVVKFTNQSANALPRGLQCWLDLAGWQVPKTKMYKISYKNAYGIEVVNFAFRVSFTYGGNLNGVGKYITNATVMPANIDVAWGFTFNADASIPTVLNMGTVQAPVAGMQLVVNWSVDTVMKHSEKSETFFVSGDGQLVHLE